MLEIMRSWNAAMQAFDYETGRPKRYVEMLSWPRAHKLHRALPTVLVGVFWESFVPTKAAATMRMVFNRCCSRYSLLADLSVSKLLL